MIRPILTTVFALWVVTGCASHYVKSKAEDAASVTIRMDNPELIRAYVRLYEDGEQCRGARPLEANLSGGVTNETPVSITVTPNKLLSLGIHGQREDRRTSCDILVSFMPKSLTSYDLRVIQPASSSACGQLQATQHDDNGGAKPIKVTARKFNQATARCLPL